MAHAIDAYGRGSSSYSAPKNSYSAPKSPVTQTKPSVSKANTVSQIKPQTYSKPATVYSPTKPAVSTANATSQSKPQTFSNPAAVYTPSKPTPAVTYSAPKPQSTYQLVASTNKQAAQSKKNVEFDAKAFASPGNSYGTTIATANAVNYLEKYTKDGFSVQKKGDYAIVKGARSTSALEEGINGTRYAAKNADKYSEVFKFVDPNIAVKNALNPKTTTAKLGYAGVALDVGFDTYNNVKNGASGTKIAADAIVDIGFGTGAIASGAAVGAAVGSVVPVAGTLVGAVAGAAAGLAYIAVTEGIKVDGVSLKDKAKQETKTVLDKVF